MRALREYSDGHMRASEGDGPRGHGLHAVMSDETEHPGLCAHLSPHVVKAVEFRNMMCNKEGVDWW